MTAILKREVRSSFHGMIGYVLTAFMLAATAIYFVALNLGYGLTDFGYYTLYRTTFVLLLYIPVLTMRSFAEERRTRTDQLLLTSPVSVWEIVLGKFFALCVIFALPCLADAVMILVLAALGATGTATLANWAALLCYYLMGCAAIAIGVFLSSLTENQIIAAVAGVAALLLAYMMPSLRSMFTAGSAVALALFTAIAAVLSVVAGLRTRSFTLGCLTFANFSILWTSMAFLLAAPPFNYSDGVIGLFGLAGAAGALGARPAGGFADKGKSHHTTTFGLLLLLLSWLAIWFGHTSVLALIIGILVLDLTVQGVHITNQTVIYRIHPDARNRLTAGYMTSYFIGGAAGSLISASAWQHGGWAGVCLAGATIALVNLLVWWRGFHRQEAAN